MARVGRFGRLPRSQPSLTNTIIAIAQQMQGQRDQNIMDAWRSGGNFQGQPVTDDSVMAYWNKRLAGISPKDPAYDSLKNNILQLEFAIADSKSDLAYRQGKITAQERGQFLLDWSKKVPQNSELWRTLQKNAAQFMQQQKAAGVAAARKSAEDDRARADGDTIKNYEAVADGVLAVLNEAAVRTGLIAGDNPGKTGSPPTVADIGLDTAKGGIMQMPAILAALSGDKVLMDWIRNLDPSFGGTLTQAYLEKIMASKVKGLEIRRDRAQQAGDMNGTNGVTALLKETTKYTEWGRLIGAWDVGQSYEQARKNWLAVWDDKNAGPQQKIAAWEAYAKELRRLASTTDPQTAAALLAEADLDTSVDSLYENFQRYSDPTSASKGDIAGTKAKLDTLSTEYTAQAGGTGVATWGTRASDGSFVPDPNGKTIGIDTTGTAINKGDLVLVPQGDGSVLPVYAIGKTVTTTAFTTGPDGQPVQLSSVFIKDGQATDASGFVIGKVYDIPVGGSTVRIYSYRASDGSNRFTLSNPWQGTLTKSGSNLVVDVTSLLSDTNTVKDDKGNRAYQPIVALDPQKAAAGISGSEDQVTLVGSIINALGYADAKALNEAINSDPAIRAAVVASAQKQIAGIRDRTKAALAWAQFGASIAPPDDSVVDPAGMGYPLATGYDNTNNDGSFWNQQTGRGVATMPVAPGQAGPSGYTSGQEYVKAAATWKPFDGVVRDGRIVKWAAMEGITDPFITAPLSITVPGLPTGPGLAPITSPTPQPAPAPVMPTGQVYDQPPAPAWSPTDLAPYSPEEQTTAVPTPTVFTEEYMAKRAGGYY